jgi:hypothetical protein
MTDFSEKITCKKCVHSVASSKDLLCMSMHKYSPRTFDGEHVCEGFEDYNDWLEGEARGRPERTFKGV